MESVSVIKAALWRASLFSLDPTATTVSAMSTYMHTTTEHRASKELPRISHWIDGSLTAPTSTRLGEVIDPARGELTAQVALADAAVVDAAVQSARRALPSWRDLSLSRRIPILQRFRQLLIEHTDELARLISSQHGKMIDDAAGEIARGLEVVELACAAPTLLKGEYSDQVATGVDTYSLRQPVGVCVGITPFNFPAMVPLWMFPIALACGNTFVLKPSERDPGASVLLAQIASEAGLPAGVLNVVHGDKTAVDALLDHPDVSAVSFVGSTPVARSIYERSTATGKRVQALGGAKNHLVVLPDAEVGVAADAAVSAAFGSAGQRCMAVSVVVAVEPVGDELAAAIRDRVVKLRVGPASDSASEMGPVITTQARDRVAEYVGRGEAAGAEILADGRNLSIADHENGNFIGPTVIDRVRPGMDVYDEEVFGPLLGIVRADTLDEALRLIDENPYGNGAAIFTRSGGAARRFVREVEAGMVGVNVPIPVPVGFYSFGGWGDSLFGDTHVYGPESFHFYTRSKVVTSRWPDEAEGVRLSFPSS
jgi:malonate-semialdehyde dehydrogenase (acetylating) / methylmalonate-semialdehyde dehydrogenase